ncbi:MAG: protein kinase domain-containing protein [Blastocatellia bacterium]
MSEPLFHNSTLSQYRILRKLGAGGMGEVYLAEDTRLDRRVALKLLPEAFTQDEERLRRFAQEAKAASALNHPNILTIHDIGEDGQIHFIATEHVEGETLRDHLRRAPLTITEALDIAAQIAGALAAAHQAGIIHRDIKPENVMLRPDGIVKVLDFGLAKLTEPWALSTDTAAPTIAKVNTDPGKILGTVNYMSPEQARGKPVDARSDLFSLGVVIYEMVAGRPPFEGETASDLIAAILKTEPLPLVTHSPDAPPELERIVTKALSKDKEERYQTAKDLLIDLKRLRRQIDVDAELERSLAPESARRSLMVTASGAAPATVDAISAQSTGLPARQTSSAEYLINGIKQHRIAVLVVLVLIAAGVFALTRYWHATNTEVAIESIAVLPFDNQSRDPDADYLSDGITESIINNLTQLPALRVIARTTVFRYKGKAADPMAVGKELGVRAVLVGRLLQRGDSLIISAELVDVRDNKQVWGEQYSRRMTDLLALQSDIARDVSTKLRVKLSGVEEQKVTKKYTENTEAYQLYLKGIFYANKRTAPELQKAVEYFQQAIVADPRYASAYAWLAAVYNYMPIFLPQFSARQLNPKAREAIQKALALDDNLAEAHTGLAAILETYDYDFAGAEREFQRALELNPNDAEAHQNYGGHLVHQGRFEQGLAEYRRALELDPLSLGINCYYSFALYDARRYDEAIAQSKKAMELDAHSFLPYFSLLLPYRAKGMYAEAIEAFAKSLELSGELQKAALVREIFAKGGWQGFLREAAVGGNGPLDYGAFSKAVNLGWLGRKDEAFAQLHKAYEDHEWQIVVLKVDPRLDPLRADPRFNELLRRVGFPQQ